MRRVNIMFILFLYFSIFLETISKPILHNSNLSKTLMDIEYIENKTNKYEEYFRVKRQYIYDPRLGPISFDSTEYESDTPPPAVETIEKDEKELYHYFTSENTDSIQSKDIDNISITTTNPNTAENIEDENSDDKSFTSIDNDQSHQYHPPSTSYGEPIISTIHEEAEIKPNKELISIADDHITKKDMEKSPNSANEKHKETTKQEEKPNQILTSYGVPLSSVIGYPPYEIAGDENKELKEKSNANITGGPPATSYGVPDKTILVSKINSNQTKNYSNDVKKKEDAKPYDLLNSSYGVPLKSVTTLTNVSLDTIGVPDPKIKQKFKSDEIGDEKSISTENNPKKTVSPKKIIVMSADDYELINVCIEKSINSAYTLKKDGSLLKDSNK